MKKKLILSSLVAVLILDNASAQTLESITITTATKTEKNIDGVTASVIVITKEDIEKTGASTIKGVLEKIPSINAQFARFPHPSSASKAAISLRGVGSNGTLLLIDGKRLSAETESPYEMSRIPASMIERIEIVKGSMSTLYGSDAIGGVINIITKKIVKNSTAIDVKYGSNKDGDAKNKNINFTTMGKNGSIGYKVYGSLNKTTPYKIDKPYINPTPGILGVTYRDEATVKSIGTRLEGDVNDDINLGIDVNYFDETREGSYVGAAKNTVPALVKGTPVKSKDENSRLDLSADLDYNINEDLSTNLKIYRSYYKKRNKTTPLEFTGPVNKKFSANVTVDSFETNLTYILNDSNLITSGLEYRKEKRESSAINPNPASTDFITKIVKYKSLFIQDEIDFSDTLHATVGARYDNISNADNKVTVQAGVIKNLSENTNLRFNYAQGYRAPDIAELFVVAPVFKDAMRFGSDVIFGAKTATYDLKPEESQTIELSLSHRTNSLFSEITLFNTNIKDKIELVAKNDGLANKYYTSENLDKVDIKGVELSFLYDIDNNFDLGFNLTYLNTENKANNKELTFTPDISASFNANYKVLTDLSTNLMVRYIGEQYTDTLNTTTADSYTLVDLGINYNINKTVSIYGGVDNIFNKEVDATLGTNVGTYFFTGLRATF